MVRRKSERFRGWFDEDGRVRLQGQARHYFAVQKYPREYAPLAYLLEKSGFPVSRVYPTKGSDLEKTIKAKGQTWLKA